MALDAFVSESSDQSWSLILLKKNYSNFFLMKKFANIHKKVETDVISVPMYSATLCLSTSGVKRVTRFLNDILLPLIYITSLQCWSYKFP